MAGPAVVRMWAVCIKRDQRKTLHLEAPDRRIVTAHMKREPAAPAGRAQGVGRATNPPFVICGVPNREGSGHGMPRRHSLDAIGRLRSVAVKVGPKVVPAAEDGRHRQAGRRQQRERYECGAHLQKLGKWCHASSIPSLQVYGQTQQEQTSEVTARKPALTPLCEAATAAPCGLLLLLDVIGCVVPCILGALSAHLPAEATGCWT